MIFSGMPGVSGAGAFVPALGYSKPSGTALPGNYSLEISNIPTYKCVLSPKTPIALILKITESAASFTPEIRQSENTIPQT